MAKNETSMDLIERMSGKILFYCQIIESDLKVIYACLVSKDLDSLKRNVSDMNEVTLGETLTLLKGKGLLMDNDIHVLHELRRIRNDVVHQSYLTFAFLTGRERLMKMKETYDLLTFDAQRLKDAMDRLENVRLRLVEKYRE